MEKILINKNQSKIDADDIRYKNAVSLLQAVVDEITKEGISIDDSILTDIYPDASGLRKKVETMIEKEAGKSSFLFGRAKAKEILLPILDTLPAYTKKVQAILEAANSQDLNLNITSFEVSNGVVKLSKDYLDHVIEHYSVYADSDIQKKAYELSTQIVEKVKELDMLLVNSSDRIRAVSTPGTSSFGLLTPNMFLLDFNAQTIPLIGKKLY